jgi:hypothetical protein
MGPKERPREISATGAPWGGGFGRRADARRGMEHTGTGARGRQSGNGAKGQPLDGSERGKPFSVPRPAGGQLRETLSKQPSNQGREAPRRSAAQSCDRGQIRRSTPDGMERTYASARRRLTGTVERQQAYGRGGRNAPRYSMLGSMQQHAEEGVRFRAALSPIEKHWRDYSASRE